MFTKENFEVRIVKCLYPWDRAEWKVMDYGLEPGLEILFEMATLLVGDEEVGIAAIAGGSASGKTTGVSKKLRDEFAPSSAILSIDDYLIGKRLMALNSVPNFDHPKAYDMKLIAQHLANLTQGQPVMKPIYSFKTGERVGQEQFLPCKLIIPEGLFAIHDDLMEFTRVRVFVQIGTHGRLIRRIVRDVDRTDMTPAQILDYFASVVQPMHEKWVEKQTKNAHIIIQNEYQPDIEAERAGLSEVQLKFRVKFDPETLRRIGGERLGAIRQRDTYFNPFDRDLSRTGESLRIREELGSRSITYKGPRKLGSDYRERQKIEFEINAKTMRNFIAIYGKQVKVIEKLRVLYHLDGLIFSVDKVISIKNGARTNLGTFVEIRAMKKGTVEPQIAEVLARLGLDPANGIQEAYVEMG
ncbi:MAG TPA: class IV adenylate cyclase [Candidatus Paceibacterota bacterium]|nr:class IV adenylate cyclase [Candidatus Pacearchaeota archaeon]HRZ50360.1 class IV adenylate cyclase [Candidatus Paceibacterota bacterium]HSA36081.1 class IV adenylate cyclase [Candidatus Paceibacterota bacterium]